MHIPDGFIDAPVSVAAGVVAAGGVAICLRRTRRTLEEATAPLAGLVAVFVFAGQMLNFPVGLGTSGHLLGGALAAILIGPWAGALAVSVVLVVQALLFADGGLTALGLNVINMALVGAFAGWIVFRLVIRCLTKGRPGIVAASCLAGTLSVVASAGAFVLEFANGGTTAIDLGPVTVGMLGVHVVIGLIEGGVTAAVVAAVAATRPDLVAGLRGIASLEARAPANSGVAA
ncbi:MAG: energy-coupling factor ABC transporter permease [Candidatus Nanopelagicales bacterium]|nr:energy-coupling factor ABC transporter permease [Candidatus Nanopelagicales bacterium]